MKSLWAWIARNERHLSAVVFLGGFGFDNLALGRIDLPWVETLYAGFLVGAALLIVLSHFAVEKYGEPTESGRRTISTFLNFGAQFFIGGLLSGCLIFYARGAAWNVSWPFIFLLGAVFLASEFLHSRKERLEFQATLFFLALYLYAIFALPIASGRMGSLIFLASGAASAILFALFLWLLRLVGEARFMASIRPIAIRAAGVLLAINAAYFTGILPPLPLSLQDAGIYHGLVKYGGSYQFQAEDMPPAWQFWKTPVLHVVKGTPLYAYSAVFAPVAISTDIVHVWQRRGTYAGSWETVARVPFGIAGGRDGGYRGYSTITDLSPGAWRVTIETESGQVIGRERFDVEDSFAVPALHTEVK